MFNLFRKKEERQIDPFTEMSIADPDLEKRFKPIYKKHILENKLQPHQFLMNDDVINFMTKNKITSIKQITGLVLKMNEKYKTQLIRNKVVNLKK